MDKYKMGIIGYGGFGQFLHGIYDKNKLVDIIAIADERESTVVPEGITFYSDWEKLLENTCIDIVAIATPPVSHARIACMALEMNKHVIIEKPMAITIPDIQNILDILQKSDRKLIVDYMLRYHPLIGILKRWNKHNLFGRLRRITIENYAQDETLPIDHWFWDHSKSGGILVEHAVHFIDLVNYINDSKPRQIYSTSHWRNQKQEDQVLLSVKYENGLIATQYHDFSRPGFFESTSFGLVFDLAQINLEGWIPIKGRFKVLTNLKDLKELEKLPMLKVTENIPIENITDESRPAGWGNVYSSILNKQKGIRSGGKYYKVDRLVSGQFKMTRTKGEIYADILNALLADFVKSIEHPEYQPRITPEDGLNSLKISLEANKITATQFTHE